MGNGSLADHLILAAVILIVAVLAFVAIMRALRILELHVKAVPALQAAEKPDVDWSEHTPGVVVETIATVVAATVAMRILKSGGDGTPDFDALRRLVYVMLRLLNADGLANGVKILKDLRIAWVHREHADDLLEKKALELLGARVEFYFSNADLVEAVLEVPVDVVISNYHHMDDKGGKAQEGAVFSLKSRLDEVHLRHLPVMLYSRSLTKTHPAMLEEYHIKVHTEEPEELVRALMRLAKEKRAGRSSSIEGQHTTEDRAALGV